MPSLSTGLYSEVTPDFFRILSGPNARIYTDALEALDIEMGEGAAGLSRLEAVEVVTQITERHAGLAEEDTSKEDLQSPRSQANFVLNRLVQTGWLSEPARPDYQRVLYFERQGEMVLDALRRIAAPEAASFTDKLWSVCASLGNPDTFADQPWSDLETCVLNARMGLQELRGMQKSVERMTKRQIAARTLRENLTILYDEFSEAIGHSCYRELVRLRLPVRVRQARLRLEQIESDMAVLERMQREVLRRRTSDDPAQAMSIVRLRLNELFQLLEAIEPQAEQIDQRAADFARRSFARFRYLQEVGGARREQIQRVFELVNQQFAGERVSEIERPGAFPDLAVGEAGLIGGLESLTLPRKARVAGEGEPIPEDSDPRDRESCLLEMEANLRDSLTALRANAFVERLELGKGERRGLAELPLRTDDDVADLMAVLLHASSDDVVYRVETAREKKPEVEAPVVVKAGYAIEDFHLQRRS
jgi:hypothetical protein